MTGTSLRFFVLLSVQKTHRNSRVPVGGVEEQVFRGSVTRNDESPVLGTDSGVSGDFEGSSHGDIRLNPTDIFVDSILDGQPLR